MDLARIRQRVEGLRSEGDTRFADAVELLISEKPDAVRVRRWVQHYAPAGIAEEAAVGDLSDWEAGLWVLAVVFARFRPLSSWERTGNEKRRDRAGRIARLARDLADAIEDPPSPPLPSALSFLDAERAVDLARFLPPERGRLFFLLTGYSPEHGAGYVRTGRRPKWLRAWGDPAELLGSHPWITDAQSFAPMLRRLARYAERSANDRRRDARFTGEEADARLFARELNRYAFEGRGRNELLAACVALRFPDLPSPPTAETVRGWLRAPKAVIFTPDKGEK